MSGESIFSAKNVILFLVATGWVVCCDIWHCLRSKSLLRQWAKTNGYELVDMRIPWFTTSPVIASRHQEVYQIIVRDARGQERCGWARCGGFWLGFLVDKLEVELHPAPKTKPPHHGPVEPSARKAHVAKAFIFVGKWLAVGAVTALIILFRWWIKTSH